MQQFTIPQFIDVEDKIIGPVTTRQFVIILAGFVLMAISYKLFDFALFLTISIILLLLIVLFAFIKINGRPFHFFLINITQTFARPKLRAWNNKNKTAISYDQPDGNDITDKSSFEPVAFKPKKLVESRLNELSLIVDTRGSYQGEQDVGVEVKPFKSK